MNGRKSIGRRVIVVLCGIAVLGLALRGLPHESKAVAGERKPVAAGSSVVDEMSAVFRAVAGEVKPAVVQIRVTSTVKKPVGRRRLDPRDVPEQFRRFFEDQGGEDAAPPPPQHSSGSGVVIDAQKGYILTNNHVLSDSDADKRRIDVFLADGHRIGGDSVKVLGTDPKTDIALIQVKAERLHAIPLGDSDKMQVGDWVLAVGAPFGLEQTVTQGIISATGRSNLDITEYGNFIQTDAAINPGNSGGPLVNMRGELIGINTAIATSGLTAGYMGIGFAIPAKMIKEYLPTLEQGKEVVRSYLGVKIRGSDTFEPGLAKSYNLAEDTGVLIEDFSPDEAKTPARKAGLKMDDIILAYDGKPVKTAPQLQDLVTRTAPGTKVELKVWREGKEITIPVTVEKQPRDFYARVGGGRSRDRGQPGDEDEAGSKASIEPLGMTVEPMSPALGKKFNWEDDAEAKGLLVVTEVEPLGEAAALGISVGDLIVSVQGEKVSTPGDLRAALSKEALAKGVRIKVRTPRMGYRTFFLQVTS